MKITYTKKGTGLPLILIHGVWMSSKFFNKNIDELSKSFTVYSVDLPGHGEATKSDGGHTMAAYATEIKLLIDNQGLQNVTLAGWSMGFFVVWEYIKLFGENNIKSAINISQGPSDFKWDDWPDGGFTFDELIDTFEQTQTDMLGLMQEFLPSMFMHEILQSDLDWMLEENLKVPANIASTILIEQTTRDYRSLCSKINIPVLLCWGRDEKCMPLSVGEYLKNEFKNAEMVIFKQSGHCPFWEEPEEFNRVVKSFIDRSQVARPF